MQFRFFLRYFLIRTLRCSHNEADSLCRDGLVEVDGLPETNPRRILGNHEEVCLKGHPLRKGSPLRYVLFYKPRGYECTTNRAIEDHIYHHIPEKYHDLVPLGRLDKNSEGLLLLTNDGQAYKELMDRKAGVEKEYRVHTFQPVTPSLGRAFSEPFLLGKRYTLPSRFEKEGEFCFRLILTEGINRQIRRICAKNENQVKQLIRIRVGQIWLGDLKPGEWKELPGFRGIG